MARDEEVPPARTRRGSARDDLALPINAIVTKVLRIGGQLVSVGGGLRYWVEDTDASPEGLGFRFQVTLLYPR